ncbi:MAG: enoyl-CoA hydratase-related protein [Alphaproteobacteria bacterium]
MNHYVHMERDGQQIAWLTLNRPEIYNAFDASMIAEIDQQLICLAEDTKVRALVLRGSGRAFCAGADLHWMKSMAHFDHSENLDDARKLAKMLERLYTFPKPTICLAHGPVFGGGVGLVAACDFAIAHPESLFCLSEVRLGLTPATISPFVVEAMGPRHAKALMLTGEKFDAQSAKAFGLVGAIEDNLDDACHDLLTKLLAGGPQAQQDIKALVQWVHKKPIDTHMSEETARRIADKRMEPEAQHGLQAFFAKEKPSWVTIT